jgi:O-antigen/teichoic acid export membrane protein
VVGPDPVVAAIDRTAADRRHLRRVARGSFYSLAGSLIKAGAMLGFTAIVTRSLPSQSDAGTLFALTSAYVVVAALIRLGAPTGLVYFLNQYRATGQWHRLLPVWRAAYVPVAVAAVLVGIAGVIAAPAVAELLVGRDDPATVTLTRVLSIMLAFSALSDLAQGTSRGYGALRPVILVINIGYPTMQVVLALVFVLLGIQDVLTLGLAWALPFAPAAILLIWWARHLHRSAVAQHTTEAAVDADTDGESERRVFWRFTGPRTVSSIAQVVIQRIDIVLVGVLSGPANAALYTAATRFLVVGQLGGQAINLAIESKVATLLALGDKAGVRAVYRAATGWLILMTWPVYFTFVGYAPDMLAIFGPGYEAGAVVVVILSVTMLVATAAGAVDTMLVMAGKSSWTMVNTTAALVVNVGLNLLLIPPYGITGAAIAWAAAIVIKNVVPLIQLAAVMRLHPFGRQSVPAMALPTVCFLILPWLTGLAGDGALAARIVGTLLGGALYVAGLWYWRQTFELAAFAAIRRSRSATSAASAEN